MLEVADSAGSSYHAISWPASWMPSPVQSTASTLGLGGHLCLQAALAQKTAVSMARSADWTTALMGLPGLLTNTSAGRQWEEAAMRAQEDCEGAITSLGRLTQVLRGQEQACTLLPYEFWHLRTDLRSPHQKLKFSQRMPRQQHAAQPSFLLTLVLCPARLGIGLDGLRLKLTQA